MADAAKKPKGTISGPLNTVLWVVSLVIGFCLVPYHDAFGGYRHEAPDLFKPLVYGLVVSCILRAVAGACFGERQPQ